MKRPSESDVVRASASAPVRCDMFRELTTLWAMLTDDAWDDGTTRERSTLLVLCDGGIVKLWLNDKALARSCWVSGESVSDALNTLEESLYAGSAAWRAQGPVKAKKK